MKLFPFGLIILASLCIERSIADQYPEVSRILFGSCIKQDHPAPILEKIARREPDTFVFLGDNIYADTSDMSVMKQKYETLRSLAGFKKLTGSCTVFATWDDHDYGVNDAGANYPMRNESQKVFLDFWGVPSDSPRRTRPGIYDATILGPGGRRIQFILLDTRFFRGPLKVGERRVGGPYYPDENPGLTMLGDAQWKWLEKELKKPAQIRIVASSIQLVAEAAGQETWSNLPLEQKRFFDLIRKTKANGVIVISGDRHWSDLSMRNNPGLYPIYDLTSSSLNQPHKRGTPTRNQYRIIDTTFHKENFGEIQVAWQSPVENTKINLLIRDEEGKVRIEKMISLSDLQFP